MENIINTLIWAAILQGLLLGLIYLLSKKYRSKSNRILGFLLLALVIEALTMAPFIAIGKYPIIGYFSLPEVKLLLPVLILHYVLEKIGRASAYHLFLKFHYVLVCPFISITLFNVYLFVFRDQHIYQLFDFQIIEGVFMTMQYYAFILTIGAIGISLYETRNYTQVVKNSYSDLDLLQIRWLWQFIFSIIPITILWGMELFRIAIGGRGPSVFVSLTWLLLIVFIYFLSYKAFQQKNLLERLPTHRKLNNLPESTIKFPNCRTRIWVPDWRPIWKNTKSIGGRTLRFMNSPKKWRNPRDQYRRASTINWAKISLNGSIVTGLRKP